MLEIQTEHVGSIGLFGWYLIDGRNKSVRLIFNISKTDQVITVMYGSFDQSDIVSFRFDFPALESPESLADLSKLRGMVDLEKVIVITGFGEVGPWGSSRTRWEMEARGEFTIEGCIEMAWMMGFIKHFDGRLPSGTLYVGWVDSKSGEPVDDKDVRGHYEKDILAHAGVRLIGKCSFLYR